MLVKAATGINFRILHKHVFDEFGVFKELQYEIHVTDVISNANLNQNTETRPKMITKLI